MEQNSTTKYAFLKGWRKVPKADANTLRGDICAALGGISISTFYSRLQGQPEPKISEAQAIESCFAAIGITDIWGE